MLVGMLGGSKGDVNVQTSTSQVVEQSANVNVNPVIAVSTPNAHFDPQNTLEPRTMQEARQVTDQSFRQADPGSIPLVGRSGMDQFSSTVPLAGDFFSNAQGESLLTTVTGMPAILIIGGLALVVVLAMMRKKKRR